TKDSVTEDIEHRDGDGKSAQSSQAVWCVAFCVLCHEFLLGGEASRMVCRPGLNCSVSRGTVPWVSRHARSTVRFAVAETCPSPKCNSGLRFPECPLLVSTC